MQGYYILSDGHFVAEGFETLEAAEEYLRNLLNTAYEVERQDYQIHLAKESKHAKNS